MNRNRIFAPFVLLVVLGLLACALVPGCSNVKDVVDAVADVQQDAGGGEDIVADLGQDAGADVEEVPDVTPADVPPIDVPLTDVPLAEVADIAGELAADVHEVAEEVGPTPGKGTLLQFKLHDAPAGKVFVNLHTMQTSYEQSDPYDFLVALVPPCPNVILGEGVEAVDLGAGQEFDEVDEAPADGYQPDEEGNLVIGASWKAGGTGSEGFQMTGNVYVLRLGDDTYGKMEILHAKDGEIHVLAYWQEDGTVSLTTADSE